MSTSNLERVLKSGNFAVTGECGPPRGADAEVVKKKGAHLKGYVDGVNVTDNQTSVVRMSSISASLILKEMGFDPIMQMVCRDRNRIAMQSDILGAAALGINNLLCLSGDHQKFGDHPTAKNVFDIDSMQLIQTVKRMRDEGKFLGGEEVKGKTESLHRLRREPLCGPLRDQGHEAGKEGCCRCPVRPDTVHLQRGQVREVDGDGPRPRRPREDLHPRGHHALQVDRHGPVHEDVRARHGCARRAHRTAQGRSQGEGGRRRASRSPSRSSRGCARSRAWPVSTSWPSSGKRKCPRS